MNSNTATQRGIYMLADTPLTLHPLATEDGSGDKNLLSESVLESLTEEELRDLREDIDSYLEVWGDE